MSSILQSRSFAAWLGIFLYLGVTVLCWKPIRPVPTSHGESPAVSVVRGPSWDFANPDIEQLITELKQEKAAVAERARQLEELAARLKAEQSELSAVTQAVHQLRRELDETFVRVADEETANLKKLGRLYAAMTPDGAAGILRQLDEATIVKIMLYMKEDESAPVLETLSKLGTTEAKLAASISERLRLAVFRKNPSAKPRS